MPATEMASSPRLIDQVPEALSPPDGHVELLVLGMSRTGDTKSEGPVELSEADFSQEHCVCCHYPWWCQLIDDM